MNYLSSQKSVTSFNFRKQEVVLFIIAIVLSGATFLYVWNTVGLSGITWGGNDFTEYSILAKNILSGHGMSLRNGPPFEPSAVRLPGYPLFLALSYAVGGNTILASILQIAMFGAIAVLSFRILLLMGLSFKLSLIGAILMVLDPDILSMSLYLISDTLYTFLFLLSFYFFLQFAKKKKNKNFLWAAVFLGISTLVRPVSLVFLPIYLIGFLMIQGWRWRLLLSACVLVGIFLVPWSIRNYYHFGTFRLSSGDTYVLYTVVGADIVSFRDKVSYADARAGILEGFATASELQPLPSVPNVGYKYSSQEFFMADNFVYNDWMNKKFQELLISSPAGYAKTVMFGAVEYFTQVNWLTPLEHWNLLRPSYQPSISFKHILTNNGFSALFKEMQKRFTCGTSCVLSFGLIMVGRLYWTILVLLGTIGAFWNLRNHEERKMNTLIIFSLVSFALLHILLIGSQVQPRYRMPLAPFFIGFSLIALRLGWRKVMGDRAVISLR